MPGTGRKAITQVDVGTKVNFSKTITDEDVRKFAEVSGDFSPLHLDEEFARKTIFDGRIAHGILVLGLVSAALIRLPGTVVYISQKARFIRPVRIGDLIEAVAEVTEKIEEKSELRLKTSCKNQQGKLVLDGEAWIKLLDICEAPPTR